MPTELTITEKKVDFNIALKDMKTKQEKTKKLEKHWASYLDLARGCMRQNIVLLTLPLHLGSVGKQIKYESFLDNCETFA